MMVGAALGIFLTAYQTHWLIVSYNIGSKYGEGYTFASVVWEESSFCQNKINGWSRGCGGLKRKTARIFDPEVTRQQLTDDNERNLKDSLAYLLECRRRTDTWRRMVYAYHRGIPIALEATPEEIDKDIYVLAIANKVKQLQSIPVSTNP